MRIFQDVGDTACISLRQSSLFSSSVPVRRPGARRWLIGSLMLAGLQGWTSCAVAQDVQPATSEPVLPVVTATGQAIGVNSAPGAYRVESTAVTPFGPARLVDLPASVSVVSRALLDDRQSRLLSDLIVNDSSVQTDYAPVGYYENVAIRGFPLDLATSYQINGMTVSGEQNIALDNKERVDIFKGLAGLEAGITPPGGVINYVTKRPASVRSVMFSTDSHGSRGVAADVGTLFGEQKQFGLRINLAHDDLHSYVHGADGVRNFASIAADWQITPDTKLEFDADDQHVSQRSVPGYQLLGGSALPEAGSVRRLLGLQSWSRPVTNDSYTLQSRLTTRLNQNWSVQFGASRSQVIVDDNSAFPYGCYFAASCAGGGSSTAPGQFFAPNGDYDVYDYRFPDDTRRNDMVRAQLDGRFSTGSWHHHLVTGVSLFRRTISQSDGVNDYVGTANIYDASQAQFAPSPLVSGPSTPRLDSRQKALTLLDDLAFSPQWNLQFGGRQVWLRESAYNSDGSTSRFTSKTVFLPQLALIRHLTEDLSVYASYSKGLALGAQAPFWATNAFTTLAPAVTRQVEAGIRYDRSQRLLLSASLFRMARPYDYAQPDGTGQLTYVEQGNSVHTGLELGATGQFGTQWQIGATLTALRAQAHDTGTAAYDGQQEINVPRLQTSVFVNWKVPQVEGLAVQGGWQYSARKAAARDGSVEVPSYHIFNAGATWHTRIGAQQMTVRLNIDNLFDKRYWKDVGEYIGDGYLFQGAPRTARLNVQFDF